MILTKEDKAQIFADFGKSSADTGSAEGQIALFTSRITHLTAHLKENKKDYSTRLGLLKLVGKRKRLLHHLQIVDVVRYRAILEKLGLRK